MSRKLGEEKEKKTFRIVLKILKAQIPELNIHTHTHTHTHTPILIFLTKWLFPLHDTWLILGHANMI